MCGAARIGAIGLLVTAAPIHAAGGAHLVDDSGTVTPGSCELESYGSFAGGAAWRAVVSPTCALAGWRGFELGVIAAADGAARQVIPGIAAKSRLGSLGPASFGAEVSLGFDPEGNQSQYVATNLAASLATFDWLELHANAGLDFEPGRNGIPTWGLAMLVQPVSHWQLVLEAAGRSGFATRTQAGLRHSGAALVFDILYSRNIDERRGDWVTAGLTWSFALPGRRGRVR